jgi:hypothetical protein
MAQIKAGQISAALWENEITAKSSKKVLYEMKVNRLYNQMLP